MARRRPEELTWPAATTTVAGVIGDPVSHSLSPLLHNAAYQALGADWISVAFAVPAGRAGEAVAALRALRLGGLSVTMPHKTDVVAHVDRLEETAERLGAVNCLTRRGGEVIGANTDGEGFLAALARGLGVDPAGRICLVVGAGGAARAIVLALARAGARSIVVVNRDRARAQAAATLAGSCATAGRVADVGEAEVVVNATPVGMAGSLAATAEPLVPGALLRRGQVAVDLVYQPLRTAWLAEAEAAGARVMGGLGMLVHQAALALERWLGQPVPVEAMWQAAEAALAV